jgi:hypothetical protein
MSTGPDDNIDFLKKELLSLQIRREIRLLELRPKDLRSRQTRRTRGLFSKADAIRQLCGTQVLVVVFDPKRQEFDIYKSAEDLDPWTFLPEIVSIRT